MTAGDPATFRNRLQIELHVPDFSVARSFYRQMHFDLLWCVEKGDAGDYMVMEREGAILCFWPGNDAVWKQRFFSRFARDTPRGFGVEIVYMTEGIETYYQEVKKVADVVEPLVEQPWGLLDFRFIDPFGYYFRVTEPLDIAAGPSKPDR
jgi:lactoylglutathione lyase